jgi:uncharacterized protein (TIGR02266 family)
MAQETRKDPRAKVLTMTVRYKSATLDEFIEHHSHDVSRGGMFIKTPSPFPPGTLLKFEVRISGDQRVMQGVGRVVWKRESGEVGDGAPAGMGVKFIKIDDASRTVIDQLVTRSGGAISAFERGGGGDAATTTPIAAPAAAKPASAAPAVRKSTMIGLGAMGADAAEAAKALSEPAQGFFPDGKDGVEEPAPEDRTVMKQAAELLQDALREAGGSMDDVGTPTAPDTKVASSTPPPQPVSAPPRPTHRSDPPPSHKESERSKESAQDALATPRPSERDKARPAAAAAAVAAARTAPASARSAGQKSGAPTSARRVSIPSEDGSEGAEGSGMGRIAVLAFAIAAIGGAIYVLTRSPAEEVAPPPPVPAEVKPEPQPEPPPPATAEPAPSAEAVPSAAASEATPPPVPSAEPSAKSKALVEPKPAPEPKPVTAPKPRPVAAPKPPAEPKPAAEPKPPAEAAPAETKPPAVPKPPAEPKPKPAPKAPEGDNPY